MADVKITFDTLFSILRTEKSRDEIQELDPSFFDDVREYLNEKAELLNKETDGLNVFMNNEKERNMKQLSNIKRVLNEIYERREKKIIEMALVKSRTKSDVVSAAGLLESEAKLYERLVDLFDNFRGGVLINLLEGNKIELKELEPVAQIAEDDEKIQSTAKKIKFMYDIPKFVGENLEVYGPFEQDEIAELPKEIAELLIAKGRARETEQEAAAKEPQQIPDDKDTKKEPAPGPQEPDDIQAPEPAKEPQQETKTQESTALSPETAQEPEQETKTQELRQDALAAPEPQDTSENTDNTRTA